MASSLEIVKAFHKTPALASYRVRCGKSNCRCTTDVRHGPYWFLHWREGTVQRRRYVRQADVAAVRAVIERQRYIDREERRAAAQAMADLRRLRTWLRELEQR